MNPPATARALCLAALLQAAPAAPAADQPQWGAAWSRNMVSAERGLPATFNVASGRNIKWVSALGTETHSTPVIAGGRVFIGTNNGAPRDPKHEGDRGVVMCLDERDGTLLWQLVVPKRDEDPYFDWPRSGISSTVTVDGDRAYVLDNRGVILCLDVRGMADGNNGPFRDEAAYMTPRKDSGTAPKPVAGAEIKPEPGLRAPDRELLQPGPLDADIVWAFDLVTQAGTWPHDGAHSSILVHGDHLYVNTSTGVDNTHRKIRAPDAPSLVVLDKLTGRYLARDNERIAPNIFHCTWSSPSAATVNGATRIVFAGGNGVVYGFKPLGPVTPGGEPLSLEKVFEFDFDPDAPKEAVHRFTQNRREGPSNIYGMPVVLDGKLFVVGGGDVFWGKNEAWLKCVDATGTGDVTRTAVQWSTPLEQHTMSTAAVAGGLVFVTDTAKNIHCFDAATGKTLWTHACNGLFWASPYVADGKVYAGTRSGDFWVLAAEREKRVLFETKFPAKISATATAANGVLYIATMTHLYAVAEGAQ
jgi:outer membrane protein assembly factor BamB